MNQSVSASWSSIKTVDSPVPAEKLSNVDLVLQCQAGYRPDKAAFSELLRRYQPHVERVLYHLAPDWQDRSDLVQEVWIRVYRNIKRLQEPIKFRGWRSLICQKSFARRLCCERFRG